MKKAVRILLAGEPGVGKTSLVLSLVSEEFPDVVPARAEEITIPADVTPEKVPTNIVDYSQRDQGEQELIEELHKADVVCIVYSVEEDSTLDKVMTHWLPYIRQVLGDQHKKPVVLVGNKTDLTDRSSLDTAVQAMNQYVEVETCVECSARSMKNISEMFYYAQKAVLHPTAPLYDADKKELKTKCKEALDRVFTICDTDNDGILNDYELNHFQRKCFNVPLAPQALQDVKAIVRKFSAGGVVDDGLTREGFQTLHLLFVQRGRHETTWTVLRKFGYDDDLLLTSEYLSPKIDVESGCSTELTHNGYQFLQTLFEKHDKDKDGCLSPSELQELFSPCPFLPWGDDVLSTVETNNKNWITNAGYLAQWTLTAYLDRGRALEYLAYLGYSYEYDTQKTAIQVTRSRNIDKVKRQTSRNVFLCHVIGPKGIGKTNFLQGHLGRNMSYLNTSKLGQLSAYTINTTKVHGADKYLLMREIDTEITELLNPGDLDCDVACLAYDASNPETFSYSATTYNKHFRGRNIPVLIIACKSDLTRATQKYEVTPEEFCKANKLPPPQFFNSADLGSKDLYSTLATMAAHPNLALADGDRSMGWLKLAAVLTAIIGIAFGVYRYKKMASD